MQHIIREGYNERKNGDKNECSNTNKLKKDMFKFLEEVASINKEIEITTNNAQGLNDGVILISKRK